MPNPLNTIASIGSINTPIPQTQIGTSAPTTREGGQPLQEGDRWFNPETQVDSVYYQGQWVSTEQPNTARMFYQINQPDLSGKRVGDFWYDVTNSQLTIFNGGSWDPI